MKKEIIKHTDIKASVLGLEYDEDSSNMELLTQTVEDKGFAQLSVYIRIKQKQICRGKLFLSLIKCSDEILRTFFIAEIPLASAQSKISIAALNTDMYPIIQHFRYNLNNIPMCGSGQYAIAVMTEKDNVHSILDAYYFVNR